MPDVGRIGGVTGWLQAAGIAAAHGIEMSSHLHPETSVHLLAASPTAHWIEYVDWADAILQEPLQVKDGAITAPNWPGTGIASSPATMSPVLCGASPPSRSVAKPPASRTSTMPAATSQGDRLRSQ